MTGWKRVAYDHPGRERPLSRGPGLLSHVRKYAVYRRALVSYLAVTCVTVIVLSAALLAAFRRQSSLDMASSNAAILEQAAVAADLLSEQVRTVGDALLGEPFVFQSLRAVDVDRYREYRANLAFLKVRSVYPFIRFVELYDGVTGRLVNTEGLTAEDEAKLLERVDPNGPITFFSSFLRSIDYTYPRPTDSGVVMSFVFRPSAHRSEEEQSFIVVNIELVYIETLLRNLTRGFPGSVAVISVDGSIVSWIGKKPPADAGLIQRLPPPDIAQRSFFTRSAGTRYSVTRARAPALGWELVGIQSFSEMLTNTSSFSRLTMAIALAVLVLGCGMLAWLTNSLYTPLTRLLQEVGRADPAESLASAAAPVDEYQVLSDAYKRFITRMGLLEEALDGDLPIILRSYLHSVLTGTKTDILDDPDVGKRLLTTINASSYLLILAQIDRIASPMGRAPPHVVSTAGALVSRSLADAMADYALAVPIVLEDGQVALVLGGDGLDIRAILGRLHELQAQLCGESGLTFSCTLSSPTPAIADLHRLLSDARRVLRYRFFSGPSSILTGTDIDFTARLVAPFPSGINRRLSEAIHLVRRDEVHKILRECASLARQRTYQGALAVYHKLCVELLSDFEQLLQQDKREIAVFRGFVEDLSDVEFAADVDRRIASICESIMDAAERAAGSKTVDLIRSAETYIYTNYADRNLCLDSVADALRVSGGHLGRAFVTTHHRSLADYINEVRIDHAKDLLQHSKVAVQEVAESVGIANGTYFFTLFKKLVGTTPARYRRGAPGR